MMIQDRATSSTQFYTWKNYRACYEVLNPSFSAPEGTPLLLIHPIGVGLSRKFWRRFSSEWYKQGHRNSIYNPDLLGCGESDMPHVACTPMDWAQQLQHLLQTVVQKPVIVIVQGALFPVAIELAQQEPNFVARLVLASPPAMPLLTKDTPEWRQKTIWNLLDSPLGNAFYRYARRAKFLSSFSTRQLFKESEAVDAEWITTLQQGATNPESRHAVFAFLAGFWRKDYSSAISSIKQPTLVVLGEDISSIAKEGKGLNPDEWLADYLTRLPEGRGVKIPGRNVLPYESTPEFVRAIAPFIGELS